MISRAKYTILIVIASVLMIHFLLIGNGYSYNQIINQNSIEESDSLLLKGDLSKVQIKYRNNELEYYDSDDLEELFRSVKIITTFDSNNIDTYVKQYQSLSSRYTKEYAGQNAHDTYEKYLNLLRLSDKKNALMFYYISVFFKKHYHKSVLKSARNIYVQANRNYLEGKYERALKDILSLKIFTGQNTELIAIEDSLNLLKKNIINTQKEKSKWNMQELRTYKLFIGIQPAVIYYGSLSDVTLKIKDAVSSFSGQISPSDLREIHVKHMPARYDHELYLIINYLVLRKLMIGVDLGYSSLSIDRENYNALENYIFYDLKLRSYMVKPYCKYLFSDMIGFSPFCNLGIDNQTIICSKSIIGRYTSQRLGYYGPKEYGEYFLHSQYRFGIIFELGADYIPGPTSCYLIGSKIGGYYFIKRSDILNNYNITFSMYIGFIL